MASTSSPASVGSVLSHRWRLVQKLGEGSIGTVYAAEPAGDGGGARVAVKVLRSELALDPVVAARFVEEGRESMRLIHPNIVRLLESNEAPGESPFVVMELLEGVPLGAYTRNGGRVPIFQAVSILQGMLAGLAAAHAQGVVHRDLKPDNVFLMRQSGGTFVVKVLDFSAAGVMDAAGGVGRRTRTGALLGTPAYMSPEQARDGGDIDLRTDLFGAGAIFYEMLTGRVAFSAPTEYARLAAVRSTDPEPVDRLDPSLAALGPLVARALQKNRDERFSSALDMARALAAAVPNEASSPRGAAFGPLVLPGTSPISRLGEVPSGFAASAAASGPAASMLAQTAPAPLVAAARRVALARAPESPADDRVASEPAPPVIVGPIGGTLPSKDLPRIVHSRRRAPGGMRPALVATLVAVGVAGGFLLGWVAAHRP
jgi:serine/threonine protein kinase